MNRRWWEFEKKDRVGKIEAHNEKGGGAAVADTVALVERTGRSPQKFPDGVQSSQVVQTAFKGPPVIYQPVGAPVVYAAGGQQCAQRPGCRSNRCVLVYRQLEWHLNMGQWLRIPGW